MLRSLCRADGAARCAIIVAHPDDEVIGAASRLGALRDPLIVHVTDGSPRDPRDARAAGCSTRAEYTALRRRERARALALAGVAPDRAWDLGVGDQEAAFHLASIARRVAALLVALGCELVLTHPYEGGHPDHDATAFAVHAAAQRLRAEGARPPVVAELTSYHARDGAIAAFSFAPRSGPVGTPLVLDERQRALKRRMYGCYASQAAVLAAFPIGVERFRLAPSYDFLRPPPVDDILYERFDWGMSAARWCALARAAHAELGLRWAAA
ncbi:MAG TPA: PIG-L family deacetylase [Gemmatimonadaceae bacterium]|nr:PIG-L family deacetylase [Gemmatimonadaceae bacterium]